MKRTNLVVLYALLLLTTPCFAEEINDLKDKLIVLEEKVQKLENNNNHKHINAAEHKYEHTALAGFTFSGQMTTIYQTSDLNLSVGDLKNSSETNLSKNELDSLRHKNGAGTFSADLVIEKTIGDNGYFQLDFQFANGGGIDGPFQGGAMVNNDVMEDPDNHNQPYLAKAFYEHTIPITEDYKFIVDIGKYGVNDFFDLGDEVADQTTQFLNQAIANNGAFDYVQDLQGHGYTYGARLGWESPWVTLDSGVFSSDSYIDNINDKYSLIGGITFTPEFTKDIKGVYQVYVFKNFGEYGKFSSDGNFATKDVDAINTADNADDLDKGGFGISLNQSLLFGVNLFAKYGKQDDDRDVRHYQDMDESYMFGFNVHGDTWSRENDVFGVAYEIGRLTGNHRKAQERGYSGFFDRSSAIGAGNYRDERVLEVYYKFALNDNVNLSVDYQRIENFYYSSQIGDVNMLSGRVNVAF